MAVNKNFVVKNGLEVNTNLLVADLDTQTVGIGTTISPHELHVVGGIGATNLNITGVATIANLRLSGVTTFVGFTTFQGDISVGGALTASTVTVQDLTNDRVVFAGTGGELEDSSNFRFDGSQLILGVGATVGGALTVAGATDLNGALDISGEANFSSGVGIADSIFHIGDDNTQIRFPANDTFTVETAGEERFRINSDGNIGIGTDDPNRRLVVRNGNGGTHSQAVASINLGDNSTFSDGILGVKNAGNRGTRGHANGSPLLNCEFSDGTGLILDKDGNLGIGTSNPTGNNAVDAANEAVLAVGVATARKVFSDSLEVGGSQVISDARQLQNIASLDSTTTATIESAIANAPNTFTDLQITGIATFKNDVQFHGVAGITSISFDQSSNALNFVDNAKATFGISSDLQIYHDGTSSYVDNSEGGVYIRNLSNDQDIFLQSDDGSGGVANYILCNGSNGQVELFHYGNSKLNTTTKGIHVAGEIETDSVGIADSIFHVGDDNTQIRFPSADTFTVETGGSERIRVGSAGSFGIGTNAPGEALTLRGEQLIETNSTAADSGNGIYWHSTTAGWNQGQAHAAVFGKRVDANNGYIRFDVRGGGTTGERLRITADGFLGLGTATPLNLYRSFSIAGPANDQGGVIELTTLDKSSRSLVFNDSNGLFVQTPTNHSISFRTNGANDRLVVTNAGDVEFKGNNGITSMSFDRSANSLNFVDNAIAKFGTGNDLQIYHDGSNSYIQDGGTGHLVIRGEDIFIANTANDETMAGFNVDGSVDLYHNGSKKFETTGGGVIVTGIATAGAGRFTSNLTPVSGQGLEIFCPDTSSAQIQSYDRENSEHDKLIIKGNPIEIYHSGSKKFETGSDGVIATGIVTATGGFALGIHSAGTSVVSGPVKTLNFVGTGNTFAYNASTDTIDISIAGGSGGGGSGVTETDTTVSTTNPTGVGSFATASFRSASVIAQINQLNTDFQVGRYLMIHDGTTVTVVEESAVSTGSTMLGSFTGVIDGSNVELRVTLASAGVSTVTTKIDTVTV